MSKHKRRKSLFHPHAKVVPAEVERVIAGAASEIKEAAAKEASKPHDAAEGSANPDQTRVFYAKLAFQDLVACERCIHMLAQRGTGHAWDMMSSLVGARDKLVETNVAFKTAWELILAAWPLIQDYTEDLSEE